MNPVYCSAFVVSCPLFYNVAMPMNPFLRPLPARRPTPAALPPVSAAGSTAAVPPANSRAQALQAIAADVRSRTARIEHVRAVGHMVHDQLKNAQHTGSSRLAWMAQQLRNLDS